MWPPQCFLWFSCDVGSVVNILSCISLHGIGRICFCPWNCRVKGHLHLTFGWPYQICDRKVWANLHSPEQEQLTCGLQVLGYNVRSVRTMRVCSLWARCCIQSVTSPVNLRAGPLWASAKSHLRLTRGLPYSGWPLRGGVRLTCFWSFVSNVRLSSVKTGKPGLQMEDLQIPLEKSNLFWSLCHCELGHCTWQSLYFHF